MAKLFEFQGKDILRKMKIATPDSKVCKSVSETIIGANQIGFPVVLKIQTWSTGRNAIGGVKFANSESEVAKIAENMLKIDVGNFKVETLLVEKKLDIKQEFFVGLTIDSSAGKPLLLFSSKGGSGIEEIAAKYCKTI